MSIVAGPNPEILRWARESIHLTINDVANRLKKPVGEIAEWETGESSPTLAQLEKLAYDVYKRPLAVFYFPEPPLEIKPEKSFRAIVEEDLDLIPSEIIKVLRKAQLFQINLDELTNGRNPMEKLMHREMKLSSDINIEKQANTIREYLNVSIEEQLAWKNIDIGLKFWREKIEQKGIFVFKEPFKNNKFSGFCLYDSEFPVIIINNTIPKTRQIFTLMHELAHLLFGNNDIFAYDERYFRFKNKDYDKLEIICNQLAAEILVPKKLFMYDMTNADINEKTIENMAQRYSVSRDVILRKLLNINLIQQDYFDNLHEKWVKEYLEKIKESKEVKGNYYNNVVTYLGKNYLNLAFQNYYSHKINSQQLAEYLSVKVSSITGIEAKI